MKRLAPFLLLLAAGPALGQNQSARLDLSKQPEPEKPSAAAPAANNAVAANNAAMANSAAKSANDAAKSANDAASSANNANR